MSKSDKAKKRGSPSRDILYSEAAKHAPKAIDVVVELMDCKNENVRLGAAKVLLSKAIPDLKATEISGRDGQPFTIKLIKQWLHTPREDKVNVPASSKGPGGQDEVQDTGVAQESKKDVDSTGKSGDGGVQSAP